MKFENTSVYNMENAIRGMRNPLESWNKSDSYVDEGFFILGEKDSILARKLINGGTEHRKFLRQIMVSVDITAPLYFWKEFSTYKIGTTANSTSTMHKVMSKEFNFDMFEIDPFLMKDYVIKNNWIIILDMLNNLRDTYLALKENGEKELATLIWKELIRLLPCSWLQTRTITMNYENLLNMYYQRRHHKLTEWRDYCDWIESLPYTQELFGIG